MSISTTLLIKCASLSNDASLLKDGIHINDGEITAPKFDAVIKFSNSNLNNKINNKIKKCKTLF